jgi:hypothetical protein
MENAKIQLERETTPTYEKIAEMREKLFQFPQTVQRQMLDVKHFR